MKNIRLSRKQKKIIRKGVAIRIIKSQERSDSFYIAVAYALQHGYEIFSDDGDEIRLIKKYKPPKYTPPKLYFDNDPVETVTGTPKK